MDEEIRAGKISIVANVFLTVSKAFVGIMVNSTALIADALHSLIDIIGSAFVWIGLKISKKPPDELHPYGHFKAESLAELGVGLIIILTSLLIIYEAIDELLMRSVPRFEFYAVGVAAASALINEFLARYKIRVGMKTGSSSLIAEGKHSRTDVLSSIAVVIGFLLIYIGYWWADAAVAMIISALILQIGFGILKNAVDILMDRVDEELNLLIKKWISDIDGVKSVDFIAVRGTKKAKIVEVHVKVDSSLSFDEVNRLIKKIESIKDRMVEVVHVIPVIRFYRRIKLIAIPVDKNGNYIGDFNAEFFKLIDIEKGEERVIENVHRGVKRRKGYLIADLLSKNGVDLVVVRRIGEGAKNHLKNKGIDFRIANGNIDEVIGKIRSSSF